MFKAKPLSRLRRLIGCEGGWKFAKVAYVLSAEWLGGRNETRASRSIHSCLVSLTTLVADAIGCSRAAWDQSTVIISGPYQGLSDPYSLHG